MNKETVEALIEMIRGIEILEADTFDTLDFSLGYMEGQNEIVDRVVEQMENFVDAESENRTNHLRAINAHLEHQLTLDSPIVLWMEDMLGWKTA